MLHDLPAAARSSASTARRRSCWSPTRTASRASAASRTATTSTRAPPTWPTCTTRTPTGAATGRYFVGAFPGLVLGFFAVPTAGSSLDGMALYVAVSLAIFAHAHHVLQDAAPHTITTPLRRDRVQHLLLVRRRRRRSSRSRGRSAPPPIALAATWFVRTLRKEKPFLERADRRARAPRRRPRRRGLTRARRDPQPSAPAGHVRPREQARRPQARASRCWRSPRPTACRSRPAAGWASAAPTRSRSRTGWSCTSPISDDEKATLERLGYADEHADGVLRARHRPGHRRAHARQGRGARASARSSTSTTTATSSASS